VNDGQGRLRIDNLADRTELGQAYRWIDAVCGALAATP
jgi:hypothetical protein